MALYIRGKQTVIGKLNREIAKIEGASKKGLLKGGLLLQSESMKEVPVMTGNLKNSCYITMVEAIKGAVVYVGYHAIYAAKTHENPRAGKTEGKSPKGRNYPNWASVGKWKFLESPLKRLTKRILEIIRMNAKVP